MPARLTVLTLIRPNMGDWRSSDALPPLAMAILAARTPESVQINFYDERLESLPQDDQPDLVAISVETFTARRAYAIADAYRARGVTVVMGGYHPSACPDEALQHACAVVVGDAEGSWERLLSDFEQNALQSVYLGGNERPLDDVRFDRSIFAGKRYAPLELVQFSRGCRFACDFCAIRHFYQDSVRTRPIAQVIDEISCLDARRPIFFVDDNLFASRETLDGLLKAIEPLNRRWACQISIDAARDDTLLAKLAKAGCVFVLIGFESLEADNLRRMGKRWNHVAGDYRQVIDKIHAHGMAVYGTFVFGYTQDTSQTITQSLVFALEAGLDIVNLNPLTPTPGTPLYHRLKEQGRLLRPDWWSEVDYRYGDPIFSPEQITAGELTAQCFAAKQQFYRWSAILGRLWRAVRQGRWRQAGLIGLVNIISRREVYNKQGRRLGEPGQ